jgi:phosphocarrier protein HPr
MIERIYTITSHSRIHARPATTLVSVVTPFTSKVSIEYKDKQINLKSIMGVMSLGIPEGATVKVIAEGADEDQVIKSIDKVMEKEGLGV